MATSERISPDGVTRPGARVTPRADPVTKSPFAITDSVMLTPPTRYELIAVRRVLWETPQASRDAIFASLKANATVPDRRRQDAALAALATAGELEIRGEIIAAAELRFRDEPTRAARYSSSGRCLLGRIRNMLRNEPEMDREDMRERLRASGMIGADGFGGRRVFHLLHYLRRRGEITMTPTHVTAVCLLPAPKRKRKPEHRTSGPRVDRWKAARKREGAVQRRRAPPESPGFRKS